MIKFVGSIFLLAMKEFVALNREVGGGGNAENRQMYAAFGRTADNHYYTSGGSNAAPDQQST
jgi:hypothetical protein